jgi:hypothetical protein
MTCEPQAVLDDSTENTGGNTQPGKVENLRPWQPGQSGNPGGRPKRKPLTDAYARILDMTIPGDEDGRTFAEAIALAMAKEAIKGKVHAATELADRVEGRAPLHGDSVGTSDRLDEVIAAMAAGSVPRGRINGAD